MERSELLSHLRDNREAIESRKQEFRELAKASEKRKFQELIFVILSAQSNGKQAFSDAERIVDREAFSQEDAEPLIEVQYPEQKAGYIEKVYRELSQPSLENPEPGLSITGRPRSRDYWVDLPGVGWKGASHFLRNLGEAYAVLSRHSCRVFHDLEVLESVEPPTEEQAYLEAEERVFEFCRETGIDVVSLDLAAWSFETGEVFR